MSSCPRCGASLADEARFCPVCGTGTSSPDSALKAEAEATRQVEDDHVVASRGDKTGETLPIPENIAAVVVYITIVPAIAFLFVEPFKRNYFVRFHAFQHLFLWVAGFACAIAAGILVAILQLIPFMRVLIFPLGGLISLAWFFLWVLLLVKAYHHETFKLPIIGDLAEQRAAA